MPLFGSSKASANYDAGNLSGSDKLMLFGALLSDLGGGQGPANLIGTQEMLAGRQQMDAQQAWAQKVRGLFGGTAPQAGIVGADASGNPGDGMTRYAGMGPDSGLAPPAVRQPAAPAAISREEALPLLIEGALSGFKGANDIAALLPKSSSPSFVEGPDGIYERTAGGWKRVQAYPEQAEKVSPGWIAMPDGSWAPKKGGPYDPDYIAKTTGIRRDEVVKRPMPRVGGGGRSGGGSSSGLPDGFKLDP